MSESEELLAHHAKVAVESAAEELGIPAAAFARRLTGGEIARLVHLLNAAVRHVESPGLRHRIEDLLVAVTDGRMPSQEPESELDWALRMAGRRRTERKGEPAPEDDREG